MQDNMKDRPLWSDKHKYTIDCTTNEYNLHEDILCLKEDLEEKQAKIDSLMLEYCPNEMTKAQKDNWAKHQKPVDIPIESLG